MRVATGTDAHRVVADNILQRVQDASTSADIRRSAPSFCEGQPDTSGAYPPEDLHRLQAFARKLDHPAPDVRPRPGRTQVRRSPQRSG
jgi:hypothetical protein